MTNLLTTEEAAAVLRIHPGTVRVNCRSGALACARTGAGSHARWRIPRASLEAFLGVTQAPARTVERAEDV